MSSSNERTFTALEKLSGTCGAMNAARFVPVAVGVDVVCSLEPYFEETLQRQIYSC